MTITDELKKVGEALEPLAAVADVVKATDMELGLWSEWSDHREPVRLLVKHAYQAKEAFTLIPAIIAQVGVLERRTACFGVMVEAMEEITGEYGAKAPTDAWHRKARAALAKAKEGI